MSAPAQAVARDDTPAQHVLENFLDAALAASVEDNTHTEAETELRIDLLYLLTDKSAHRRALPLSLMVEELRQVQVPDRSSSDISEPGIKRVLYRLLGQKLVREFDAPEEEHFELAHDFLVRSVVRKYRELDRKRIRAFALLERQRDDADTELRRLSLVERSIFITLRVLSLFTVSIAAYLIFLGAHEKLPNGIGLSLLWFIACPCLVLLLLGVLVRRRSSGVLGALGLAFCCGIWIFQMLLPSIDVGEFKPFSDFKVRGACDALIRDLQSANTSRSRFDWDAASTTCYIKLAQEVKAPVLNHFLSETYSQSTACSLVEFLLGTPVDTAVRDSCVSASRQRAPIWRINFTNADTPKVGFTLRPHQLNLLDPLVGLISIGFVMLQIALYPMILASTSPRGSTWLIPIKRVSVEFVDVILSVALAVVFHRPAHLLAFIQEPSLILQWFSAYWLQPLAGLGLYAVISLILLRFAGATPGGLLTGMRTASAKDGAIGLARLFGRQIIFTLWAYMNLFGGIPSLLITPLYVYWGRSHELLYDSLLHLRTVPRENPY